MTKTFKVLLIDDSEAINEMNRYFFNKSNPDIEVNSKMDGQKALSYLTEVEQEEFPDLILLDLRMPLLDGFEFLTKMQDEYNSIYQKLNVVLLTTSMNPEDEKRIRKFNCVSNYMIKPLSLRQVSYLLATNEPK